MALLRYFQQFSLQTRVQLTVVTLLFVSFVLVCAYVLDLVSGQFNSKVQIEARNKAQSIGLALTEPAILGDFPAIKQSLQIRVAQSDMAWISFNDGNGHPIIAYSPSTRSNRPDWFARLLAVHKFGASHTIQVGGQSYGQVQLQLDTREFEDDIWKIVSRAIFSFAFVLALTSWAIARLLRVNLGGLIALRNMAQEFEQGHVNSRAHVSPHSPPEIVETAHAFNLAADRVISLMDEMRLMAFHDSLTGLPNRRALEGRLARALREAQEKNRRHAFCYMDLDQFKLINDTCGHAAGDELLSQLSGVVKPVLPESAYFGRLGGDEFGLLLFNTSTQHAAIIARLLIDAINDFTFHYNKRIYHIGVSVGIAPINNISTSPGEILAQADMACFSAKQMGRNRLHVFEAARHDTQKLKEEMDWVGWFGQAVTENRLVLFRQRIDPATPDQHAPHYEILLRIKRAQDILESPVEFLQAAERFNLAPTVDRWVFRTLCGWLAAHPHDASVYSVNLSGLTLNDEYFLDFALETLDIHEIDGRRLAFEITETAAVHNLSSARRFIDGLKARDCQFYLDDFGIGMASFSYLKQLPVDYLKIDGSFVMGMLRDPTDFAIVNAFNQIAHDLSRKSVAECVESAMHLEKLREIGVDYVQGYAIHVPEPLPR